MNNTTPPQTIAFLGATGGCTFPVLVHALRAGHHATALARNPAKLRSLLLDPANPATALAATVLDTHLTVIPGSAQDPAALRALLTADAANKTLVDALVCGIGSLPAFSWNPLAPATLQQPNVCETAMRGVVEAVAALRGEEGFAGAPPVVVAISTTGVSSGKRDVPVLCLPAYHWLGAVPHKDKRKMEECVVEASGKGTVGGFVVVRPSLLVDGEGKGRGAVRVGWEGGEGAPGPAVGYTIARRDVADWIWEEALLRKEKWVGRFVSLTY